MRQKLIGLAGGMVLALLLTVGVSAQGPASAQIQAALRAFLTQAHSWTATQTFTNLTVSGTCTGCGGVAGGLTTQIQVNEGGIFAGYSALTYTDSTHHLNYSPTFSTALTASQSLFTLYPVTTITANSASQSLVTLDLYMDTEESGGARNINATSGLIIGNDDYLTGTRTRAFGELVQVYQNGGTINGSGYYGGTVAQSALAVIYAGSVNRLVGHQASIGVQGGTATLGANYYAIAPTNAGTLTTSTSFYAQDLGGITISNPYYAWFDSRGVYRIKEDSTVDGGNAQAIFALYNPRFTKYTPGAANFERLVQQWVSNRVQVGTEVGAGGGNVQRAVDIITANLSVVSTLTPAVADTSLNSCGSGTETIAGNDNASKVTVIGSAGTSCTVTFATAFTNAPSCTVTNETSAALVRATSTVSTVILAGVFAQNDVLAFMCIGR